MLRLIGERSWPGRCCAKLLQPWTGKGDQRLEKIDKSKAKRLSKGVYNRGRDAEVAVLDFMVYRFVYSNHILTKFMKVWDLIHRSFVHNYHFHSFI